MTRHKPDQILGLDLLRCAAALGVMFHHLCFLISHLSVPSPVAFPALEPYTWFGWVGAEVFFVISGFVITYSSSNATAKSFLKSRFLRLFPTIWLCSSITFIALLLFGHVPHALLLSEWLRSVVLPPWNVFWLDPSYWTLPVEISFYALVFLLLLVGEYQRFGKLVACIGIISAGLCIYAQAASLSLIPHWPPADHLVRIAANQALRFVLLRHGLYFALGAQLWMFYFERRSALRLSLLSFLALGAVAEIRGRTQEFVTAVRSQHPGTVGRMSWLMPAIVWGVAMLAFLVSVGVNDRIAALLGSRGARITRKLGLATYPIYLLHQVIGILAIEGLHRYLPDGVSLLLVSAAIIAFCLAALPILEAPIQRKLRLWLGVSSRQRATPAATLP